MLSPYKVLLSQNKDKWIESGIVAEYPYEMGTLFPEFSSRGTIHEISLSWSEVRLNRDIHWGFRLIYFIGLLIQQLDGKCKSTLLFENFQYADRLSVFCTYHILKNIKLKNTSFIINTSDYMFESMSMHLDNGIFIRDLIKRIKQELNPTIIKNNEIKPGYLEAKSTLQTMNYPSIDKIDDSISLLRNGNVDYKKILENLHNSLVLFNLENTLYLADEILQNLKRNPTMSEKDILFEVWRHVGIAQCFMNNTNQAVDSFTKMINCTTEIAKKMKGYHFLALLYGKRLGNWDMSKEMVKQGLILADEVSSELNFEIDFEKSWLYNFSAYISYYVDKDFKLAMDYVVKAFKTIKPYRRFQTEGNIIDEIGYPILSNRLIANLTVNSDYLYYYSGNYKKALKRWKSIEKKFLSQAPKAFRKEHFYYEGNIYLKLGELDNALKSLNKALQNSLEFKDIHTTEIVTRNLAYVNYLASEFENAHELYQQSLDLKIQTGKQISPRHYMSIIISLLKISKFEECENQFNRFKEFLDKEFIDLYTSGILLNTNLERFLEKGPVILFESFKIMEI